MCRCGRRVLVHHDLCMRFAEGRGVGVHTGNHVSERCWSSGSGTFETRLMCSLSNSPTYCTAAFATTKSKPRAGPACWATPLDNNTGPNIHVGCMCGSEFRMKWNAMRISLSQHSQQQILFGELLLVIPVRPQRLNFSVEFHSVSVAGFN